MSQIRRQSYNVSDPTNKSPVYCKRCMHLKPEVLCGENIGRYGRYNGIKYTAKCFHPNNIIYVDEWDEPKPRQRKSPKVINRNNDCVWFEKIVISDKEDPIVDVDSVYDNNIV